MKTEPKPVTRFTIAVVLVKYEAIEPYKTGFIVA